MIITSKKQENNTQHRVNTINNPSLSKSQRYTHKKVDVIWSEVNIHCMSCTKTRDDRAAVFGVRLFCCLVSSLPLLFVCFLGNVCNLFTVTYTYCKKKTLFGAWCIHHAHVYKHSLFRHTLSFWGMACNVNLLLTT